MFEWERDLPNAVSQASGIFSNCGPGVNNYQLEYKCTGPVCSSITGFQKVKCNKDGGTQICSNDVKCPPGISSYQSNFTFTQNDGDPWKPSAQNQRDSRVQQQQLVTLPSCSKFSLTSDGTKAGTKVDEGGKAEGKDCPKVKETPSPTAGSGLAKKTSSVGPPPSVATNKPQAAQSNTGSRRHAPKNILFITFLLGLMMLLPGAQASPDYDRQIELRRKAELRVRDVSDKVKTFAQNFGDELAARANAQGQNGQVFAHNLVADVISSVCDSYFGGVDPGSFSPVVVQDCVKSVYGGEMLAQSAGQFFAVFGASLLCDYTVSEAYPVAAEFFPDGCEGLQDLAKKIAPSAAPSPATQPAPTNQASNAPSNAPSVARPTVAAPSNAPSNAPPSIAPPSNAPPSNAPPSNAPPSVAQPSNAPPTNAPRPTNAPPSNAPPSIAPPSNAPSSNAPPSNAPPSNAPPSVARPSNAPPSIALPSNAPPSIAPPSNAPPLISETRIIPPPLITESRIIPGSPSAAPSVPPATRPPPLISESQIIPSPQNPGTSVGQPSVSVSIPSVPGPSSPGPSAPGPSFSGPSSPGPSSPGPSSPGPSSPGPSSPRPSSPGPSPPGPSSPGPSSPGPSSPGPSSPGPSTPTTTISTTPSTPTPTCSFDSPFAKVCPGAGCVNLGNDKAHCGGCGQICVHECYQGQCLCPISHVVPGKNNNCTATPEICPKGNYPYQDYCCTRNPSQWALDGAGGFDPWLRAYCKCTNGRQPGDPRGCNGINCPEGYTRDSDADVCCARGTSWNSQLRNCTKIPEDCPTGQYLDQKYKKCCTNGTVWDPEQNKCTSHTCPAGQYLDEKYKKCCANGTTWDPEQNKCVTKETNTCPTGFTPLQGLCCRKKTPQDSQRRNTAPPLQGYYCVCPDGRTFDSPQECNKKPDACPTGQVMDETYKKCCPQGLKWNPQSNNCTAPATTTCPTGQVMDETYKKCCPQGQKWNPQTSNCTVPATTTCPTGQVMDETYKKCCPQGQKWNPQTSNCTAPATTTCPTGQVMDETYKKCCPQGQKWNPQSNNCTAPATSTCPPGYSTYAQSQAQTQAQQLHLCCRTAVKRANFIDWFVLNCLCPDGRAPDRETFCQRTVSTPPGYSSPTPQTPLRLPSSTPPAYSAPSSAPPVQSPASSVLPSPPKPPTPTITATPTPTPLVCPASAPDKCTGVCVDTKTNLQHCGACGVVCSGSCNNGGCAVLVGAPGVYHSSTVSTPAYATPTGVGKYIFKGLNTWQDN